MNKSWWKITSILILVYVFIAGMLGPLKPGIIRVDPQTVSTGQELVLQVEGYNSHYLEAGDAIRAWLKLDDERALGATSVQSKSETQLEAVFAIPQYLPVDKRSQDFVLVVDNAVDGVSLLPSAVFVRQDSIDPDMGLKVWKNTPIEGLHYLKRLTFPFRNILQETIRNTYFHVALWLAMVTLFMASLYHSIKYLRKGLPENDRWAVAYTTVGSFYGVLGLVTGAIWATSAWGKPWSWDVKQTMTLIALFIYLAYFVLRAAFEDPEKRGRLSAVYNIFAFAALIPLIYVIPRLTDSLHPGNGGNPAFGSQDLDNTMRMVFYPAVIGWTLLGVWIATVSFRVERLHQRMLEGD